MSPGARAVSSGLCAAVLAVPLAAFPGVLAPFDAPKAWWLQAIVIVTALAWVLQHAQPQGPPTFARPDRSQAWLLSIVAAYASWWVLTTITSVAPGQSVLGSFARGFGLLTVLAAIALFPLVQAHCRTVDSGRSLIDAALLGSVPVCVLALGQAFGWNGLPGTVDPATNILRVRSTLGQHIFLGSYLVPLISLTAARFAFASRPAERVRGSAIGLGAAWVLGVPLLVWLASARPLCWPLLPLWAIVAAIAWGSGRGKPDDAEGSRGISRRAILGALLTGQILVVTLCGARGPFLAMVVALAVVLSTLWRSRRTSVARPVLGAIAVLACLGVALGVLLPKVASLRTTPATERLAMREREAVSSATVRLHAWSATLERLRSQAAGREVIPGQSPWLRTAVGYGLDTQEFILESFVAEHRRDIRLGLKMRRIFDRAHNVLLDHVITGGLVGAGLWIALLLGIVVVGVGRLRAAVDEEWVLRLGCLGAVAGHLVESGTGMETAAASVLFWITAALLTVPLDTEAVELRFPGRYVRALWMGLLACLAVVGTVAMAATTVWLLGSMAFTSGLFSQSAGQLGDAQLQLLQATRLVPWLPAPRSAAAELGLRMAGLEPDPARRIAMARDSEALLDEAPRGASVSADLWLVRGKIALARAMDGEPEQFRRALASFVMAHRLRANDAATMSTWSLALLRAGQLEQARDLAKLTVARRPLNWQAWAVLALASGRLGDLETEEYAAAAARRLVPPAELPVLERLR